MGDAVAQSPTRWQVIWTRLLDMLVRVAITLMDAAERALLFVGCIALHRAVSWAMMQCFPVIPGGDVVRGYVDTIVFAAFMVVYLALLYEVVAVFIPVLRPFKRVAET